MGKGVSKQAAGYKKLKAEDELEKRLEEERMKERLQEWHKVAVDEEQKLNPSELSKKKHGKR